MTRWSLYVCLFLWGLAVVGCASTSEGERVLGQEAVPKIDVHAHYPHDRHYLIPLLAEWNMRAVSVNVVKESDPQRPEWNAIRAVQAKYPERLLLGTSFDASRIGEPRFAERVISQLREDIENGAVLVKVWKNVGMVYRDEKGSYIQINDPRLQPIWDALAEEGVPVLAHIGEPQAAWRPLDEDSPHYSYYKNNPEYHNYGNEEVPSWETIMQARDDWLARNPDLTVIGAHLGSMSHDTREVAARLDQYDNFYVDTAGRFADLAQQPRERVRQFFIDYQDRILYGTDLNTRTPGSELSAQALQGEKERMEARFRRHWAYLAGADTVVFERGASFRAEPTGLDLPRDVIEKVYAQNAERRLGLSAATSYRK